jgi:RNA polymerase sigma factor (sigma-70 family)
MNDMARNQLVSAYLGMRAEILRFLTARLGQAAAAEDVCQDLFVRIESAHLPPAIGDVRGFIYKMAYNLANDYSRAGQRRQTRDRDWFDTATHKIAEAPIADAPDADAAIDAKRRLAQVAASLKDLPPKCLTVFTCHRLEGLSQRETAAKLGITTKTVEKHMATALRHLIRKCVGTDGPSGRDKGTA